MLVNLVMLIRYVRSRAGTPHLIHISGVRMPTKLLTEKLISSRFSYLLQRFIPSPIRITPTVR